jgi:hypothetical protein
MNQRNPSRRPPRAISDSQHSMLTGMHRDVDARRLPPHITELYEKAVSGEAVTQRDVQRVIEGLKEHAKPNDQLPLLDKQVYWLEKLRGEEAAAAAEQLTRDQFPRLVIEALEATYGTRDFDELLQQDITVVRKWALHLVGATSLMFGSSQRERHTTLIQAAVQPRDLQAPMRRLYADLRRAAGDEQQ